MMVSLTTLKRLLRNRTVRPGLPGGGLARRPLRLEALEDRLCPSQNPYLYVTSYATDNVMRYDELTGAPMPADGLPGAQFIAPRTGGLNTPLDVLVTPNGDLLVDSAEDGSVKAFDITSGSYNFDFVPQSGALFLPTGMIFTPDYSHFLVAALGTNTILHYDYDGQMGSNRTAFITDPGMNGPAGMVFGPDGNLYVTSLNNSSVLRYDGQTGDPLPADGQTGAIFVPPQSGGLSRAGGIVFGPDGNLYVSSEASNQVMRYDGTTGDPLPADGQTGAIFVPNDPSNPHLNQPAGMVFGPDSNLYVASIQTNSVIRFDGTTGDYIDDFIPPGSGGLARPRDITFWDTDPVSLNYIPENGGGGYAPTPHGSGKGNTGHHAASGQDILSGQDRFLVTTALAQLPARGFLVEAGPVPTATDGGMGVAVQLGSRSPMAGSPDAANSATGSLVSTDHGAITEAGSGADLGMILAESPGEIR
jgi:DNA-binding beta-propeller fold protein YncE